MEGDYKVRCEARLERRMRGATGRSDETFSPGFWYDGSESIAR